MVRSQTPEKCTVDKHTEDWRCITRMVIGFVWRKNAGSGVVDVSREEFEWAQPKSEADGLT